ncbi:Bifunctional F420 biosynthesis protein FbiB [Streptomyces sp. SudanB5_2050]|uniref:nitroreductase family protein n=1 Tax=Streptomyces sp. SudanB5_2050 TaxID=3035274 RepID=UPI0036D86FDA
MTDLSAPTDVPPADRDAVLRILQTTHSVRRRLDTDRPVDLRLVHAALEAALQAPNGSNEQPWHWIVVTDPRRRTALARCYREAARPYLAMMTQRVEDGTVGRGVLNASLRLTEVLDRVPVMIVPCLASTPADHVDLFRRLGYAPSAEHAALSVYYGSIWPAVWSLMLALRAHSLASAVTALHLTRPDDANAILNLPEGVTQAALLAVAHPNGESFHPAPRRALDAVLHHDTW